MFTATVDGLRYAWTHVITHSEIQRLLSTQPSIKTLLIENILWHYNVFTDDVFYFTGEQGNKKHSGVANQHRLLWNVHIISALICNFCCSEITVKNIDTKNKTDVWHIFFILLSHAYWEAERYAIELQNLTLHDKSWDLQIHPRNE